MQERTTADRVWRVFYTAPRAEKKCEERLIERDIDVFLPKYEALRQWKDRKKRVVEPLFRSYIFARVDEQERLRVLQTDGIVRCVTFNGVPATVDEDEIAQLKIAQQDPKRLALVAYPLPEVGEEVTVVEGPLQGLRGRVIDYRGEMHLILRVTAIRQAVRVHVPRDWIRRDSSVYGK